ncbi:hypothetical protein [Gordonia sp. OPL2]|uniref:hypothetical protein n=1 Tax=Gordonia sp. OPL2 TaxID=2486274 RepID=UPI0016565CDF|nr:hypothetical protein [Gordonia sp. OPL2]ROZ99030.1 hypothetical protein EEB19_12780 [Gordonia sp. OPL2]
MDERKRVPVNRHLGAGLLTASLLVATLMLAGCGTENEAGSPSAGDAVGTTSHAHHPAEAARPAPGPRAVPQKGSPTTPEPAGGPGAVRAQLAYLCSVGDADATFCTESGLAVPPDPKTSTDDPAQLRDLCSRGQAADALCGAAGFSMPVASIGSGPADSEFARLCSEGTIDPSTCRGAGY